MPIYFKLKDDFFFQEGMKEGMKNVEKEKERA